MKFISVKGNDECPKCPADALRELPCPISEFYVLEITMKHIRKSKELKFYCIIFKICKLKNCSWIAYFLFHHKIWL